MKCKIICGAPNNPLDIVDTAIAKRQLLDPKKITYVPDTLGKCWRSI